MHRWNRAGQAEKADIKFRILQQIDPLVCVGTVVKADEKDAPPALANPIGGTNH